MKTFLVLATSFVLGFRHALDPDHVAAVTHFISVDPRPRSGALFGLRWSLGHAATVLAIGSLIVLLGLKPSPAFERGAEIVVGATLIALAVFRTLLLVRERQHAHKHAHDGELHEHPHTHPDGPAHVHPFVPTLVGMLHGAAGTFAIFVLIPISFVASTFLAYAYVIMFSLGCMISMSGYGFFMGRLYGMANQAVVTRVYSVLVVVTSAVGFLLGVFWIGRNL